MAIHRDNENLSATPFPKELRALLDASPVYDKDNVYLSEEGWIYRHFKKADKSRWWDEILFSGEVDTTDADNAPVSATVSAGVKLGSADYTPTLETGDGTPGFGYGDTEVDDGGGGGVPPAADTTVDSASVTGEATPVTNTTHDYSAAATGDATPYTYSWTVVGGTIDAGDGTGTITVTWGAAGAGTVTCEVGSSNANWDSNTQTDTLNVTIGASTTIGGVNLDIVPAAMTVGVNATFAASIGGDATVTWEWRKASGPGNATITFPNASTTQISVDAAGDYVFTAEASSNEPGLVGGSPNSQNTGTITASVAPVSIGTVTIDTAPATMTVATPETFTASADGDANVTWNWTKASGPGSTTFGSQTSATTTISVARGGDYVFKATASSADDGLTDGPSQEAVTASITVTGPVMAVTLVGDTSGQGDGTQDTVDTTAASGSGLQVSYDVSSGTASNLVLKTSGTGYVEGESFTVDGDTGVTGTISTAGPGPVAAATSGLGAGTYNVTVAGKTTDHPYNGQGSSLGYIIDGQQSPEFAISVGEQIYFSQADASNSNHPIRIYTNADKSGGETATGNLTTFGTPGNAGASVSWTPDTAGTYYYMCQNHDYMGGVITVS